MQVLRRMYCFQESDPASLPQPVALLPPKAPPISAPFVGQLTFTMPESAPLGPSHLNKSVMLDVNNDELNPASTSLFQSITFKKLQIFLFSKIITCLIQIIKGHYIEDWAEGLPQDKRAVVLKTTHYCWLYVESLSIDYFATVFDLST